MMLRFRLLLTGAIFCLLPAVSHAAPLRPTGGNASPTGGLTIAVSDFTGADRELGRFLAETLLTDLAQSQTLHLVERTEIRKALTELKLQATGLFEPQQVKELGKMVRADRLIVGSFLLRDTLIIVNARLLDVRSGQLAPGGAANVSGDRNDLLLLTHRLARQFHRRVTGTDLRLDDADPQIALSGDAQAQTAATTQNPVDAEPPSSRRNSAPPSRTRAAGIVTEGDLALLLDRLQKRIQSPFFTPLSVTQPAAPVSRVRVLAALVKLSVSRDEIVLYRSHPPKQEPPDNEQTPLWARPYVAAAMEQGWWPADRALHPRDTATRDFVEMLLTQMGLNETLTSPAPARKNAAPEPEPDAYTGLIIDARDLPLERQMGPRILDESGRVLYPDPDHVPDIDYLEDHGMVDYPTDRRNAERAGKNPLVVPALDVLGAGHDDVVVSNETAERIREANRHGYFFSRWAVCILISAH
jgi:TolB-like protein